MIEIGFKNFRKFANEIHLSLGDINLLVGGNNSGKSTVVKAVLLITTNIQQLIRQTRFLFRQNRESPNFNFAPKAFHDVIHIGTFNRAVNMNHKEDAIEFFLTFRDIELSLKVNPFITGTSINNDYLHNEVPTADIQTITIKSEKRGIKYILNFESKNVTINISTQEYPKFDTSQFQGNEVKQFLDKNANLLDDITVERIDILLDKISELFKSAKELNRKIKLEFLSLKRHLEFIKRTYNGVNQVNSHNGFSTTLPISIISSKAISFFVPFIAQHRPFFMDEDIIISEEDLERIGEPYRETIKTLNSLSPLLKFFANDVIDMMFFQVPEYIYAHSVNQKTLYPINSDNDFMSQTIEKYFRLGIKDGDIESKFVEHWLSEFNISSKYTVLPIAGCEAFTVKIGDENIPVENWQNLAEKGMGSIQIFILLLRIATIIRQNDLNPGLKERTDREIFVMVEEPEQNLHPSMQSKLADLFNEIHKEFKIRFIVETHSEYLIRRAQVLCGDINNKKGPNESMVNPFKVFYFPEEGQPYEMGMETSGQFINNFNDGFFDVAAKLNMTVSRRERNRLKQ